MICVDRFYVGLALLSPAALVFVVVACVASWAIVRAAVRNWQEVLVIMAAAAMFISGICGVKLLTDRNDPVCQCDPCKCDPCKCEKECCK